MVKYCYFSAAVEDVLLGGEMTLGLVAVSDGRIIRFFMAVVILALAVVIAKTAKKFRDESRKL